MQVEAWGVVVGGCLCLGGRRSTEKRKKRKHSKEEKKKEETRLAIFRFLFAVPLQPYRSLHACIRNIRHPSVDVPVLFAVARTLCAARRVHGAATSIYLLEREKK